MALFCLYKHSSFLLKNNDGTKNFITAIEIVLRCLSFLLTIDRF
jgi:hypothetical protein